MKVVSKERLEQNCDRLVLKTIEDVLINVFGAKTFEKMVRVMEENFSINWDEIPHKSEVFSRALKEMLGVGSIIIEDLIIEILYINFGLELRWKKGFTFSDYINELYLMRKTVEQVKDS